MKGVTEIGIWSEIKLQIIRDYATEYSKILSKQGLLKHDYIDAFAGAGIHISREKQELVSGSPLNALHLEPPFDQLYLIDLDGEKTQILKSLTNDQSNVHIFEGDASSVLSKDVFPHVRYEQFRRALLLLDPYGLHPDWNVIETAGKMGSIEIFLNFPIMDMNRNHLLKRYELANSQDNERMTAIWGDESWKTAAWAESSQASLFGDISLEKQPNKAIAKAFQERLRTVAGFEFVPEPISMQNKSKADLYYLFFASHNQTGNKIATHILNKYRGT